MKKRYRLYIDESGDHTKREVHDPNKRYLCLLGLFIESGIYESDFYTDLECLKRTHFSKCPDHKIVLHRRDIINKRGPFKVLEDHDKKRQYDTDLLRFLTEQDYNIIGVTIDKKTHFEKYGQAAFHPYNYCLVVLLERYCGFLNYFNAIGDVMVESRGGHEDNQLKKAYTYIYENGTRYRPNTFFHQPLTSKELKLKKKNENIAGLQIADLLAYDVKKQILIENGEIEDNRSTFAKNLSGIIEYKYNKRRSDNQTKGYGKVLL